MILLIHRVCTRARWSLFLALIVLLTSGLPVAQAANTLRPQQAGTAQTDAAAVDSPRTCINPLMVAHIVATLVSLSPVPGYANAADAAAYALLHRAASGGMMS
jgi:hypothetical protein